MAASSAAIEEFLSGPLVTWLSTCVKHPEELQVYENFFDGGPIVEVLQKIAPQSIQPIPSASSLQNMNKVFSRIKILHNIVVNIQTIYEDLKQIVIRLPNCIVMAQAPESESALNELKTLLLLLLGCAVQAPSQKMFIAKIKVLSFASQVAIMDCILKVTEQQEIVWTPTFTEENEGVENIWSLHNHFRSVIANRDQLLQAWFVHTISLGNKTTESDDCDLNHLAVELAEKKTALRKQRQELDEKTEDLMATKEDLNHQIEVCKKLRLENNDLLVKAKQINLYKDEADALRETAEKVDFLEVEIQRYKEKLSEFEFFKRRVEEFRNENSILLETKQTIEDQLTRAQQNADRVLELESELLKANMIINDKTLDCDASHKKIQELAEEIEQLQQAVQGFNLKNSKYHMNNSLDDSDDEPDPESTDILHMNLTSGDNSLSEQLNLSAQTQARMLELENKKLQSAIDTLKESSFRENAPKIYQLKADKKKLSLECEQLQAKYERCCKDNSELKTHFQSAIEENKKLRSSLDSMHAMNAKKQQDYDNVRVKMQELDAKLELSHNESKRLIQLNECIQRRADETAKSNEQLLEKIKEMEEQILKYEEIDKCNELLREQIGTLEKEKVMVSKEVLKLKEQLESKAVDLDEKCIAITRLERDLQKVQNEQASVQVQLERLTQIEQNFSDLQSQVHVKNSTIEVLQKELLEEKYNGKRVKTQLDKLGVSDALYENSSSVDGNSSSDACDTILTWLETIVMANSDAIVNIMKAKSISSAVDVDLKAIHASVVHQQKDDASDCVEQKLQREAVQMQVDLTTLNAHAQSLKNQQLAQQIANKQLVAERDEVIKQKNVLNQKYEALLTDYQALHGLHRDLNLDYENVRKEVDSLKILNRDLRTDNRLMKDQLADKETLESERDRLREDASKLDLLRTEHSKLREDFRVLFITSDRKKTELKTSQDESNRLANENKTLHQMVTDLQSKQSTLADDIERLETENTQIQQQRDMLVEMNHQLDIDRMKLMDSVTQLFTQLRMVVQYSLDNKEIHHSKDLAHAEELHKLDNKVKNYEQKIFEYVKNSENVTPKKTSFSVAPFLKFVSKGTSYLISKISISNRNRQSLQDDCGSVGCNTPNNRSIAQSELGLNMISGGSGVESNDNDSDNSLGTEITSEKKNVPTPDYTRSTNARSHTPFKRSTIGHSLHGHRPYDEVALRRSHRDNAARRSSMGSHRNSICVGDNTMTGGTNTALSLSSAGSRKTVYLSEEAPTPNSILPVTSNVPPSTSTSKNLFNNDQPGNTPESSNPPYLVYNRISVTGGVAAAAAPPSNDCSTPVPSKTSVTCPQDSDELSHQISINIDSNNCSNDRKTQSTWFDYGCL